MSTSPLQRRGHEDLPALVRGGEVDTVVVAICDTQGRLQGKRVDARFFLDDLRSSTIEGCAYLLATDVEMRTVGGYQLTSWDQGYGDLAFVADLSSARLMPWHDRTAIVICDVATNDHEPVAVSPRQVLKGQIARLSERGWRGLCGTELEFLVFSDSYDDAWSRAYRPMTPVNRFNVDYSIQGSSRVEPLLGRLRREMRAAGMIVESSKGECHNGQHEIAFKYDDLLAKCDEHSIFKLGAKEIADQEAMSLTFMAKFDEREGNSCHIHLSLVDQTDRPVFAGDGPGGFSQTFEAFLGGLIAHAGELSLLMAPNVNSYKRFVPGSFAPTALAWGRDNRTCAFRVVGQGPSLRVECRIPGGDVNPYMAVSALVVAGLAGIDEGLALPVETTGNAYESDVARVPSTIHEAISLFEASELARHAFGDAVVEHYAHAARVEEAAFNSAVTDWERVRGFERL